MVRCFGRFGGPRRPRSPSPSSARAGLNGRPRSPPARRPRRPRRPRRRVARRPVGGGERDEHRAATRAPAAPRRPRRRETDRADGDHRGHRRRRVPGAVSPEAWAAFDAALAGRLIGGGDDAAAVAIAVDGEIVHAAEFGYRVPPPPAPPGRSRPSPPPATDATTLPASSVPSESAGADRARRPLPHRQHLQGHHRHRRAAARRGGADPARRAGRRGARRAGRRRRSAIRPRPASPCASCCRTPPGSRPTSGRSSAVRSTRAQLPPRSALSAGLAAAPGTVVPLLEPQLLPARPARRAGRRTSLRGRRQGPPARPAGHRGHAPGRDVRSAIRPRSIHRSVPVAQLHGDARRRRVVGRHAVGHRDDRRLPRSDDAGLAPAVAAHGRADASARRRRCRTRTPAAGTASA